MTQSDLEGLVEYEQSANVVTLRLNRPEKLNAFSDELVAALMDALRRFDDRCSLNHRLARARAR